MDFSNVSASRCGYYQAWILEESYKSYGRYQGACQGGKLGSGNSRGNERKMAQGL
jgi:hypothetical protein